MRYLSIVAASLLAFPGLASATATKTNDACILLMHIPETNAHQLRGETDNTVLIDSSGHNEAVYGKDKQLITKGFNQGSYNYYARHSDPLRHFAYDTLPWLAHGNAKDDPTSREERVDAYIKDMALGQTAMSKNTSQACPEAVPALSEAEREAADIFSQTLAAKDTAAMRATLLAALPKSEAAITRLDWETAKTRSGK
jgi:hypothetical protein